MEGTGRSVYPFMDVVDKLVKWIDRHPRLAVAGMMGLVGGAIGLNAYKNNKKFAEEVDSGIAKAKAEIMAAASIAGKIPETVGAYYGSLTNEPPVADLKIDTQGDEIDVAGQIIFNISDRDTQNIVFNASESYDPDGKIVEYDWELNTLYSAIDKKITKKMVTSSPLFEVNLSER